MPTLETINVGLAPNDKKGDPLRNAMQKVNLNFSALNTAIQGVLDGKGQANGYASLGADGRLLAAQAPIVYSAALPTTAHDLNTYVTPGTFYQTTVTGATAGANYPVLNVGFLEVVATGTPVLQVYTTRTNVLASMQRFWRVRQTAAPLWSPWKEVVDTSTAFSYRGGMIAAQDLNNYTQRGMWVVGSSATASGGTNYPIGQSGVLLVYSVSADATPILTTGVVQVYYAANSNQTFTRSLVSTVWSPWARQVDANMMGAANGVATLNGASQVVQNLAPARALGASENLNDVTAPGSYYMNSNASATATLNYPALLAGLLEVEAAVSGNVQIVQRYTTQPVTNPRTFVRLRFASSLTWGAWFELARFDQAMTHTYILAVATDANTLVMDNMWWSWANSVVMSGGSNFPPAPIASSGILTTQVISPTYMVQTCMMTPGSNRRPIEYRRIGNGSTSWSGWRIIAPVQLVTDLPTADCGDVYVDGVGWHSWNGTAYALMSLATTLPTTAHDLNSYQTPGTYRQGTVAGASAGTNYPIAIGGYLEVISGGTGSTVQRYTVASTAPIAATGGGPRLFWRVAIGSTWGQWQEAATRDLAVTHTFLTAATDANTLTADNTFYTWAAAAYSSGANFPGYQAAGYMQVFWHSATNVSQEITLLVGGGKPLKFARFGNPSTGVWQSWKVTSAFNSTSWMPTSNMGDIYVDGEGWYAWNGSRSAYVRVPPTPNFRHGLKTVFGTGTTAITVQPGACASALGEVTMTLAAASTRTIQTSGAFVHGATGNGLLSGARTANTWYYIFLLRRNSDGDCCVAFDTAFNCANRPSTHSYYRRIGCVFSGATNSLYPYVQFGNEFWYATKMTMYNQAMFIANTVYTPNLPTPPNVAHVAKLTGFLGTLAGNNSALMNRWYDSGGGFADWSYVLIASPSMNTVNDWEIPVPAVATPVTGFQMPSVDGAASIFVKGYTDLFED
ncbi:pyocin knob domain-containing protein [Achromobacter kerstersii]